MEEAFFKGGPIFPNCKSLHCKWLNKIVCALKKQGFSRTPSASRPLQVPQRSSPTPALTQDLPSSRLCPLPTCALLPLLLSSLLFIPLPFSPYLCPLPQLRGPSTSDPSSACSVVYYVMLQNWSPCPLCPDTFEAYWKSFYIRPINPTQIRS